MIQQLLHLHQQYRFIQLQHGSLHHHIGNYQHPPLRTNYQYLIQAFARDKAGNDGPISAPKLIRYDTTPPTVAITLPNKTWHNQLPTISGTALDTGYTGATISKVKVTYQKNPPGGFWWDGSAFTTTEENAKWEEAEFVSMPNWYKLADPVWENATQYKIKVKSIDAAGNESTPVEAVFGYDVDKPLSAVTYPPTGNYYSSITQITGTCYDATSGVEKVEIQLVNVTDNLSWFGSEGWKDIGVYGSSWVPVNLVYTSSWSYTQPVTYTSGKVYRVTSRAWDVAGSSEAVSEIPTYDIEFRFDAEKPQSQVTQPYQPSASEVRYYWNLTTLSGTALDQPAPEPLASGIREVEVAIQNKSIAGPNNWWGGSAFNSPQTWFVATGSTSWTYTFNNANWTDGQVYLVLSRAKDKAIPSNVESSWSVAVNSVTFICDKSTPTSNITWPTELLITNSLTAISGTSQDIVVLGNASGIQKTEVSIQCISPVPGWWNGVNFTGTSQQWFTANNLSPANTTWAYTGFAAALVTHSTYVVYSRTFDNSLPLPGNYETPFGSSRTFVYDITKPTSVITLPIYTYYTNNPAALPDRQLPLISGTAFDQFGISKVEVLVRDLTSGSTYWTGSSWIDSEPSDWPDATGTNIWQFTSTPTWQSGRQYRIYSKAKDAAGNIEDRGPALPSLYDRTFIFDNTPPVSRVTYPEDGKYYISPTVISGTADDVVPPTGPNISGILNVKVIIKRLDTNQYWDGTSWVSTVYELDTNWIASEKRWYRDYGLPNWEDGVQYQIQCRAYDNATNPEPEPLHPGTTWRCDKTPPLVYLQRPIHSLVEPPNKYYNLLPTISGTAYDANPLSKVEVRIYSYIDGGWWDGNNWNMGLQADAAWFTCLSTTNWSIWYTTFTSWQSGYVYRIEAKSVR